MVDLPDRRRDDEGRERLVRVETQMETNTDEQGKLRLATHGLVSQVAALGLMAEEGREDRKQILHNVNNLVQKLEPITVAVAQGSTIVAMHIQSCGEVERRHDAKYAQIEKTLDELRKQMQGLGKYIWIGLGGVLVISFMAPLLMRKLGFQ